MSLERKILIIPIIFSVASLILIFLGAYPLFEAIRNDSKEFVEIKKEQALLENKINDLEQFRGISQPLELELKEIDALFIDQKVPIGFIEFLEKTAKESEILISISSLLPQLKENDPWPSLSFQLGLNGSFVNCSRFIEKIESAPYLIESQSLTFRKLTEKDIKSEGFEDFSKSNVKGTLLIKVFAK